MFSIKYSRLSLSLSPCPSLCVSLSPSTHTHTHTHTTGTWASWWSRYNVIRSGGKLDFEHTLNSKDIEEITLEEKAQLEEEFENWKYHQSRDEREIDTASRDRCLAFSRIMMRTNTNGESNYCDPTLEQRKDCYRQLPRPEASDEDDFDEEEEVKDDLEDLDLDPNECVEDLSFLEEDKKPEPPKVKIYDKRGGKRGECYHRASLYEEDAAACFACLDLNLTPEMAKDMTEEQIKEYDVISTGNLNRHKSTLDVTFNRTVQIIIDVSQTCT